jgi:hypothetical protein
LPEFFLDQLLDLLRFRHRLSGTRLLERIFFLNDLLENAFNLRLDLWQDHLGHLVVHALDLFGQERDDQVAHVLPYDPLAHALLHRLLYRRIDLLLLLLLAREQLLKLVGFLGQLLVLSRQLAQVLHNLLLLDFL